jgi:hypothetical protein
VGVSPSHTVVQCNVRRHLVAGDQGTSGLRF